MRIWEGTTRTRDVEDSNSIVLLSRCINPISRMTAINRVTVAPAWQPSQLRAAANWRTGKVPFMGLKT